MRLRSEGSNMNEHAHVSMVVFNNLDLNILQELLRATL